MEGSIGCWLERSRGSWEDARSARCCECRGNKDGIQGLNGACGMARLHLCAMPTCSRVSMGGWWSEPSHLKSELVRWVASLGVHVKDTALYFLFHENNNRSSQPIKPISNLHADSLVRETSVLMPADMRCKIGQRMRKRNRHQAFTTALPHYCVAFERHARNAYRAMRR